MNLRFYQKRFSNIKEIKDTKQKNEECTKLMNDLEQRFNIPMQKDVSFEQENAEIISFYREVANERVF
uniref:hypothetical protein n=1 Tax=uncultured Allobacillus sp. TaxID=1638025 RepID=UPI002593682A|nr:hypothetical protein [uncultured Allobacillus sp.]